MLSLLRNQTAALGIVLCLILLCIGTNAAAQPLNTAEIRIGHHSTTPDTALIVPLSIMCDAAVGCGAFSVEINFDPAVIRIERVELGPYLGESAIEAEKSVDHDTGTIRLAAAALGEIEASVSGELATIHVLGLEPGVSPLQFVALEVGDLQGMPVPTTAVDGSVVIVEEGPLEAVVDLPEEVGFQCYSDPADDAEQVGFIHGGAVVTVIGRLEQPLASDAGNTGIWLSIELAGDGDSIGPCWTTSQSFRAELGGQQIDLDALWDVLPRVTADEGTMAPEDTALSAEVLACTVRATKRGAAVRVGPGTHRAVRSSLPVGEDVAVIGWFKDDTGSRWWKIQPDDYSEFEVDRYWVAEADVTASGVCDRVAEAEPSRFVFAPVPVAPTAVPTVVVPVESFVAVPAAPGAPSSGEPAPQQPAPQQPAPAQPSGGQPQTTQPQPAQPEPVEPQPTCYSVSLIVRNEGNNSGGGGLSPAPNCDGGKYLAGTSITVHLWGDVDAVNGCGITDYIEEPTAGPFSVTGDCTVIVNILL